MNDIDPQAWLADIFARIAEHPRILSIGLPGALCAPRRAGEFSSVPRALARAAGHDRS
jgi:hypothetical protein